MQVAMMLYEGFRLLEVTGPMDVFHEANRLSGATLYEQHLVGASPGPVACSNGVAVGTTESLSDVRSSFEIVVVPGSPAVGPGPEHRELVDWLRDAGSRVRWLASVSNGAFLIARADYALARRTTSIRRVSPRPGHQPSKLFEGWQLVLVARCERRYPGGFGARQGGPWRSVRQKRHTVIVEAALMARGVGACSHTLQDETLGCLSKRTWPASCGHIKTKPVAASSTSSRVERVRARCPGFDPLTDRSLPS